MEAAFQITKQEQSSLNGLIATKNICAGFPERAQFKHSCLEALVLEQGRLFRMSALPTGFKAMKRGRCFKNAWELATTHEFDDDPLYYCEGFAIFDNGFPCHHAWVVKRDGTAYDPTWHKSGWDAGTTYAGIPFTHRHVLRTIARTGLYGVLGDGNAAAQRLLWRVMQKGLPRGAVLKMTRS